jgi:hypothetical protein
VAMRPISASADKKTRPIMAKGFGKLRTCVLSVNIAYFLR